MLFETKEIFAKYTDAETFARIKELDTLTEMLEYCKDEYAELNAVRDASGEYSYGRLYEDVENFRAVLKENGIQSGENVGIYGANCYDHVKAFLAVTTYGCTAVILPPQLDDKTVYGCSMKFRMSALVYSGAMRGNVDFADNTNAALKCIDFGTVSPNKEPAKEVTGDTPCVIIFTGGTTGRSKGALLCHRAVMQGTINGCYGVREVYHQRYMLALPLSHVFGLIRNMLTPLFTGSEVFICKSPKDLFSDIPVFRPNILVLVPALAEMALNLSKKFNRNMLGEDLKTIICGAAPVSPYLIEEYHKLGITLLPGYGLTESANLVSGNPENLAKPESVGIPYPHQEFKLVDDELWLKGPNMLTCYYGEDEENAKAFEDGWFKTGDLVRLDDDGFLYIIGRSKDIIVLPSGENISPAEVESYFNSLSIIQDSLVSEEELENGTHILSLEVVPRMTEIAKLSVENVEEYVIDKLKEVNAELPSKMKISKFTVRDKDFDRTPSMKIVRVKKCK